MAKIINLPNNHQAEDTQGSLPERLKQLIKERKAAKREPLTHQKVKATKGFENLSDQKAEEAVDTIKALARLLFEIHCSKEVICIDNQQVVSLNPENKAA